MRKINEFINEKLRVSSRKVIPSIDAFVEAFGKYINKTERGFGFSMLESCKKYDATKPETFVNVLPSYEFTSNEEFLTLPGNKYFVIPKGTIYISSIDMFKDSTQNLDDYYFTLYYLPKAGLTPANFQQRRNFDIFKDDLIEIIGEDVYLEIYDYMQNYK